MIIRFATPLDASEILEIYSPFVKNSPATFETTVPSISEMQDRMKNGATTHPWIVAQNDLDKKILGYAYASPHRSRAAYQWCVESSVYLCESARGQGTGTALYDVLFEILRRQQFVNVYAGITSPYPPSEKFHQKYGFQKIGIYPRIGFKIDRWHDVGWWEYRLREVSDRELPLPPTLLAQTRWPSNL